MRANSAPRKSTKPRNPGLSCSVIHSACTKLTGSGFGARAAQSRCDALRDLGKEAYQLLRRPVRGERDDTGQTGAPGAEGERREPTHAHAGDDDGTGAAAGQPRDRRL